MSGLPAGRAAGLGAAVGLAVLTVAVVLGATDSVDAAVRRLARPGGVWGPVQIKADYVVEGLRPTVLAGPLMLWAAAVCLARRSLRPAVLVGVVGLVTVAATLGLKLLLGRPDPGATGLSHGGSYPSGHTVTVVVCFGLVVMLLPTNGSGRRRRPLWSLPAVLGVAMGASMVVQSAHWVSDVLGGGLLGITILAAAHAVGLARWANRSRYHSPDPALSCSAARAAARAAGQPAAGQPAAGQRPVGGQTS